MFESKSQLGNTMKQKDVGCVSKVIRAMFESKSQLIINNWMHIRVVYQR